jgi:tRNA threonylcarbamoyladenosine biosynthesis protein TsaB
VLLLAFDTATPAITVAVHDGSRVLASSSTVDAHRHAELLTPAIAGVLDQAGVSKSDLTTIAAGVGPGPYTGLRVGVVTARVLASTLGIPGYGVCTLDVIAAAAQHDGDFLVATDARRREVYWASYSPASPPAPGTPVRGAVTADRPAPAVWVPAVPSPDGPTVGVPAGVGRVDGPAVAKPLDVPGGAELPVAGAGSVLYPDAFPIRIYPEYPDAGILAGLVAALLERAPVIHRGPSRGVGDTPVPFEAGGETGGEHGGRTGVRDAVGAGGVVEAGGVMGLLPLEPLYLRRPDAREPGARKSVLPS